MSYEDRRLIFAGAGGPGMGTPWGTIGALTKRILSPLGYELHIESRSSRTDNARYVGDGKADLGATHPTHAVAAYHGRDAYAGETPRRNLRVIACINHPSWIGVAVKANSGIDSLADIKARRLPVRVKTGGGRAFEMIWAYYGLSRDDIEEYGGEFLQADLEAPRVPWVLSGEFDLFVDTLYAAYTPEARHWWEASVLHDLRFLPLPDELIRSICEAGAGDPGFIPNRLMRGVTGNVPTVARLPQLIYTCDEMPEDFAHLLAKALDDNRHVFRETHIPYSYDSRNVARDVGIPLHPGAERYYREMGYLPSR